MSRKVEDNAKATQKLVGGITGKGFKPGQSGNPGGMKPMSPEVKAALAADSLPLYHKAKALLERAEQEGDLRVAAMLVMGLLKKSIPDAQELLVGGLKGAEPIRLKVDPRALTKEQLQALVAVQMEQLKKQNG